MESHGNKERGTPRYAASSKRLFIEPIAKGGAPELNGTVVPGLGWREKSMGRLLGLGKG